MSLTFGFEPYRISKPSVLLSSSVKFLSCLKLLQAARAFQQKLESEVSTFLSMAKNEENYGKCFRHIQLLLCRDILGEYF